MARPDDVPPVTLTTFAQNLLTLDALAHHYGRSVPRKTPSHDERFATAEGAYVGLSGFVHRVLLQNLRNPEFEAEVHRLIKNVARLNRRHHGRRNESGPKPPIPIIALAYFIEQHTDSSHATPCFPWWWAGGGLSPRPGDEVPDIPPFLGRR